MEKIAISRINKKRASNGAEYLLLETNKGKMAMNKTKFTTIQISDEVWTKLNSRRGRNESFNLVVKRLLEKEDGTKIRTRKNI